MSVELTETKRSLEESVEVLNRVPTPPLEGRVEVAVAGMYVQEAVHSLEDTLSQKQWTRAVQLLRSLRWAVGKGVLTNTSVVLELGQNSLERS